MADPTDPTQPTPAVDPTMVQNQTKALNELTNATTAYSQSLSDMTSVGNSATAGLHAIERAIEDAKVKLTDLSSITEQQAQVFALTSSAAVSVRDAFTSLNGVDMSQFMSFTEKFKDVSDAFTGAGTVGGIARQSMDQLADSLKKMGIPAAQITAAMQQGFSGVMSLAQAFAKKSDNMQRATNAYVQMAAASGDYSSVIDNQGRLVSDLTERVFRQNMGIADNVKATGLSVDVLERYSNELGKIPGNLNATVAMGDKMGDHMNMLTATLRVAAGTMRPVNDVIKDLNTAFVDYGLVGDKALQFSARMADVARVMKEPVNEIADALKGAADAFKMFTTGQENASKASEGLANIMASYGSALESTGLSAKSSTEIIAGMVSQVGKLSLGQQAFISQQTGGPGGLAGAFRIEQRLQQGDTAGVINDVMKTLERQMGRLVSVDEAARSEASANQLTKQTSLLQSLLGPMVKDRQTAEKLIQATINQQKGITGQEQVNQILEQGGERGAADRGLELQAKSVSFIDEIRGNVAAIRYLSDREAYDLMQKTTAAGAPKGTTITEAQGQEGARARRMMNESATRAGARSNITGVQIAQGATEHTSRMEAANLIKDFMDSVNAAPAAMKANLDVLTTAVKSGDTQTVEAQREMLRQQIANHREVAARMKDNVGVAKEQLDEANKLETVLNNVSRLEDRGTSPGQAVGAAARNAVVANTPPPGTTVPGTTQPGPAVAGAPGQPIKVEVHGKFSIDCPNCGKPISQQAGIYPQQYNH